MKQTTIRISTAIVKAAAILAGGASYLTLLPPAWAKIGLIVFGGVSVLKDLAIGAGDLADDGERNDSFHE